MRTHGEREHRYGAPPTPSTWSAASPERLDLVGLSVEAASTGGTRSVEATCPCPAVQCDRDRPALSCVAAADLAHRAARAAVHVREPDQLRLLRGGSD